MKLYAETEQYKLYEGSMLDMLDVIPENSIDAIVTDPPYELNFMNKGWDRSGIAFQKETWERCLKVLKPGGYLLSFGGSRTFHRIACAIEDAGFEIRDTVIWLYGCYSEDTQVLTDSGWKYFYDLDRTEQILQWDKDTNKLSWIHPLNYFEYDIDDELCLFENRHISQLVTKNHKVVAKIKKRRKQFTPYEFVSAEDFKKSWIVHYPLAGELDGSIHEDDAYIIGWWLTDAWRHKDGKACMFSQSKSKTLNKLRNWFDEHDINYSEYLKKSNNPKHNDEHTFYVTGELANKLLSNYYDRVLTWDVLKWDTDSRKSLLEGLMDGDGSYRDGQHARAFWSKNKERLDIFQALCISLNYRAYISNGTKSCVEFNVAHNSTETESRHCKPNVPYKGKVYCLQTETGAFVVRRNGKAFISGNSGFPKSLNIGLSIDKKLGVDSEVIGYSTNGSGAQPNKLDNHGYGDTGIGYADGSGKEFDIKQPTSKEAQPWIGWGTALKPAFESITVARKPCEGSTTDNVLKYGVGGINIDECRIGVDTIVTNGARNVPMRGDNRTGKALGMFQERDALNTEHTGRFPANVILTYDDSDFDEVCGRFPNTKSTGGSGEASRRSTLGNFDGGWNRDMECANLGGLGDEGSAARYFYCAKASKLDRDEGLDGFVEHSTGDLQGGRRDGSAGSVMNPLRPDGHIRNNPLNPYAGAGGIKKNNHPTVKPTSLMQYLVRLVSPKGSTILDPFNGSGSTGKAVMFENRSRDADYKYIGIDLSEEYLEISKARIEYAMTADISIEDDTSVKLSKPDKTKPKTFNLFDTQ